MQTHQYKGPIFRNQTRGGQFVAKMSIGIMAALILLIATFSMGTQSAHAHVFRTCSAHDRTYTIVSGDTLGKIGARYRVAWSLLASHNQIAHPDLIYVNQSICIPAAGSRTTSAIAAGGSARATGSHAPAKRTVPPQRPAHKPVPPPVSTGSGSVTAMIRSVFGAYAPAAIRVAACESGLNPGASNPAYYGGSHAAGLFQILYPSTWRGTSQAASSPYNARANVIAAHEIFMRDGHSWREWTCKG